MFNGEPGEGRTLREREERSDQEDELAIGCAQIGPFKAASSHNYAYTPSIHEPYDNTDLKIGIPRDPGMVQYQSLATGASAGSFDSEATDYWELKNARSHGELISTATSAIYEYNSLLLIPDERLRYINERIQRGVLNYNNIPINGSVLNGLHGLLDLSQERRLPVPSQPLNKQTMIHTLEQADEVATFNKLVELPREIRERIYEFHFLDFEGVDAAVEPPPITRVSKLLRKESLPLWYEVTPLYIDIRSRINGAEDLEDYTIFRQIAVRCSCDLFAKIKRINLTATLMLDSEGSALFERRIHITRDGKSFTIDLLEEVEDEIKDYEEEVRGKIGNVLWKAGKERRRLMVRKSVLEDIPKAWLEFMEPWI